MTSATRTETTPWDPPENWSEADKFGMTAREELESEALDDKLAAEEPEPSPADIDVYGGEVSGDTELRSDDELDHIDPSAHGTDEGQTEGAPEDGDSIFPVVE